MIQPESTSPWLFEIWPSATQWIRFAALLYGLDQIEKVAATTAISKIRPDTGPLAREANTEAFAGVAVDVPDAPLRTLAPAIRQ